MITLIPASYANIYALQTLLILHPLWLAKCLEYTSVQWIIAEVLGKLRLTCGKTQEEESWGWTCPCSQSDQAWVMCQMQRDRAQRMRKGSTHGHFDLRHTFCHPVPMWDQSAGLSVFLQPSENRQCRSKELASGLLSSPGALNHGESCFCISGQCTVPNAVF